MKKNVLFIVTLIACLGLSAQSTSTKISKDKEKLTIMSLNSIDSKQKLFDDSRLGAQKSKSKISESRINPQLNLNKDIKNVFHTSNLNELGSAVSKLAEDDLPDAVYFKPDGYFYWGLNEEWYYVNAMLAPAYTPARWYNTSEGDAEYLWTFVSPTDIMSSVTFTEDNPVLEYPGNWFFSAPMLKATANGKDSIYTWNGPIQTGGQAEYTFSDGHQYFGACNYDVRLYKDPSEYQEGKYAFGSGSDDLWSPKGLKLEAIGNYFEKPLQKYFFTKVWIPCEMFDATPDAEFTLIIHRINDEGFLADTIATSVCPASDVLFVDNEGGFSIHTIPFTFTTIDPDTELEVDAYLEVEDAIFMELKGFTDGKVKSFGSYLQGYNHPAKVSYASAYFVEEETGKEGWVNVRDLYESPRYTSFLFNMDAMYPFMLTDNNKYDAPISGGSHSFKFESDIFRQYYIGGDYSEWVTIGNLSVDSESRKYVLPITVSALPSSESGRKCEINFLTPTFGELTFEITQGDVSGIESNVSESAVKAVRQGSDFILSYPVDMTSVSVYGVSGQKVAGYSLNASGQFTMPAADLAKGIYILKFEGNSSKSLKIVK